jgi:hypothetical protein
MNREDRAKFNDSFVSYMKHIENNILLTCLSTFSEFDPYFEGYGKLLQRVCNNTTNRIMCKNVDKIRSDIVKTLSSKFQPKIDVDIDSENKLQSFLNKYSKKLFLRDLNKGFFIKQFTNGQREGGIDESGVSRQTFADIAIEIKESGMFIPCENGSIRYTINPDFNHSKILKGNSTESQIQSLYEMVGSIFAFYILNGLQFDFELCFTILYRMIEDDAYINSDKVVGLYLLDNPSEAKAFVSMMRDPSSIKDLDINFNDYYPLLEDNKKPVSYNTSIIYNKMRQGNQEILLTKTNFKNYLRLYADHRAYRTISKNKPEITERLNAFLKGFNSFNMRDILQQKNVNIFTLNSILSVFEITKELIKKLVSKLLFLVENEHKEHPVIIFLPEILRSFGSDYPDSEMRVPHETGETIESYNKRKIEEFKLFVTKLLGFFSGVPRLLNNTDYSVKIIKGQVGRLPTSHMCFIKIDIPDYINTKELLYKKLIQSVFMTANATTQAGGKNLKKST